MSIATLASDTAVSVPSQHSTWVPRAVLRAISNGLRQPVRWPFSSGSSQGGHRVLVPVDQPQSVDVPAVSVTPAVDQAAQRPQGVAGPTSVSPESSAALSRDTRAVYHQSIGTASSTLHQGLTLRQKVSDVLLIAVWGAVVPALMWLGSVAGF